MSAMNVPAGHWGTRADLMNHLRRAQEHLNTGPLQGLLVARAAEIAGLSVHHFIRLFKATYRETPSKLIGRRRICLSKRLLTETKKSIQEVAYEAGYRDAGAFSRRFRQTVGVTPTGFRTNPF